MVLPAPFGPRKPNTSPVGIDIVNPASAVIFPYRFASSSVRIASGAWLT